MRSHRFPAFFPFRPRRLRAALALALAMLLAAAPELGSETVTLNTYYPSPAGVYTRLITTSNAYLARDGASYLTVRSAAAPAAGTKLAVMGGNVGFGINTPASRLDVFGLGGGNVDLMVNGRMLTGDGGGAGGVWLGSGGQHFIGQFNASTLGMYNNGWRLFVANNGFVGIGRPAPVGQLDVEGPMVGRTWTMTFPIR